MNAGKGKIMDDYLTWYALPVRGKENTNFSAVDGKIYFTAMRDISIGEMSHVIRGKKLYPRFYSLLRRSPRLSKMQLVNEMQKSL